MPVIVTKDTPAEDLITSSPQVLDYLIRKGICGIRCAFPLTGTLEQLAAEKNFSASEIERTILELNNLISKLK